MNTTPDSITTNEQNLAIPQFSTSGSLRTFGGLKEIVSSAPSGDDAITLHGGLPPPQCFPIRSMTVELADGTSLSIPAMVAQQQYNIAPTGYPPLQRWCADHVRKMHSPPAAVQHQVLVTDGSTHGLSLITSLLLDPGDTILIEEYTYPHFLEAIIRPNRYHVTPLQMDDGGIIPGSLEESLTKGKPPKLLYTVPIGQNPTSATTGLDRKRQIYDICRRHNVFILEDDPYCYITFPAKVPAAADTMPGLYGSKTASYLSLDVDGRVIRLDSFAKCLAPGLRLGWATSPPAVAEKIAMGLQAESLGASMICQTLVHEMMDAWGDEGLHKHLQKTQHVYAERAAALAAAAEKELAGLAEWTAPTAGMFMWVKLLNIEDSAEIMPDLMAAGVIIVPGRFAKASSSEEESINGRETAKCPFVRISFSNATPRQLEEGVRRLAEVLRAKHRKS